MALRNPDLCDAVIDAYRFAQKAHEGLEWESTQQPYITHPIHVARILDKHGFGDDLEVIMAALLHDTVEKSSVTVKDIRNKFGDRVAYLVDGVTNVNGGKGNDTFKKTQHYAREDRRVIMIKLADMIHNSLPNKAGELPRAIEKYRKVSPAYIALGRELGYEKLAGDLETALFAPAEVK